MHDDQWSGSSVQKICDRCLFCSVSVSSGTIAINQLNERIAQECESNCYSAKWSYPHSLLYKASASKAEDCGFETPLRMRSSAFMLRAMHIWCCLWLSRPLPVSRWICWHTLSRHTLFLSCCLSKGKYADKLCSVWSVLLIQISQAGVDSMRWS